MSSWTEISNWKEEILHFIKVPGGTGGVRLVKIKIKVLCHIFKYMHIFLSNSIYNKKWQWLEATIMWNEAWPSLAQVYGETSLNSSRDQKSRGEKSHWGCPSSPFWGRKSWVHVAGPAQLYHSNVHTQDKLAFYTPVSFNPMVGKSCHHLQNLANVTQMPNNSKDAGSSPIHQSQRFQEFTHRTIQHSHPTPAQRTRSDVHVQITSRATLLWEFSKCVH
jgi:hypothetical protein